VQWTATGLGSVGAPALGGGTLFVPTDTGKVLLFPAAGCGAATCSPLSPVGFDTGSAAPVTAVAVAGDVVYAVSAGQVYASGECFPEESCLLAWHDEGYGTPVISGGQLYVTDGNASLIAYGLDS
jgi:outer membrane protein assembly factor BamB